MRIACGIVGLTIVVFCSACASGEGTQRQKVSVSPRFTACDVIRTFREVTGQELAQGRRVDFSQMGGSVTDEVSAPKAGSTYGEFSFVIEVTRPTAPGFALRPAGERPDSHGIYWTYNPKERPSEQESWAASKVRRNVKLTWWNPTKSTDSRWDTLNRVLETMRHSKSSCT